MSFLTNLVGLDSIIQNIFEIVKRFVPDKSTQDQLQHEIELYKLTSDFQNAQSQIEVNKAEAEHDNIFVAGWRPFIGWVCGIAFIYHVILVPVILFIGNMFGHSIPVPVFDHDLLNNVLFGMLGLGGFRTAEKIYKQHAANQIVKTKIQYGKGSPNYQGK